MIKDIGSKISPWAFACYSSFKYAEIIEIRKTKPKKGAKRK